MSINAHYELQLVPKLLLQVSVRELHNSMVSLPEEGELMEERDAENITIISDSTLLTIIPPQLKKMSAQYKVMCGCERYIYDKIIHLSLLSYRDHYLRKIKNLSQNTQNRMSGKKPNSIFETYKIM